MEPRGHESVGVLRGMALRSHSAKVPLDSHRRRVEMGLVREQCCGNHEKADKDILPVAWLFEFYVDRPNTVCIPPDKAGRSSP
jgi:hypothetical protein